MRTNSDKAGLKNQPSCPKCRALQLALLDIIDHMDVMLDKVRRLPKSERNHTRGARDAMATLYNTLYDPPL